MQAYLMPCWWVNWWLWRAGCILQDTYLLYVLLPGNALKLKVLALVHSHLVKVVNDKVEINLERTLTARIIVGQLPCGSR